MWHIAELYATYSFNTHFCMADKMYFLSLLAYLCAQWTQERYPKSQWSTARDQVSLHSW